MEDESFSILHVEVFKSDRSTFVDRRNVTDLVIAVTAILDHSGDLVLTDIRVFFLFIGEDVAGDIRRIFTGILKRSAV